MEAKLNLEVPAGAVRSFRQAVEAAFPKEAYGLLLGYQYAPGEYQCDRIVACPSSECRSSKWKVQPKGSWLVKMEAFAKENDLQVIGDIHSHCYAETDSAPPQLEPSAYDWHGVCEFREYFEEYAFLCVMTAVQRKGRIRTKVGYWPAGPDLKVKVQ